MVIFNSKLLVSYWMGYPLVMTNIAIEHGPVEIGYLPINKLPEGMTSPIQAIQPIQPPSQWPFQEPKLEVPTIYKAYIRPM